MSSSSGHQGVAGENMMSACIMAATNVQQSLRQNTELILTNFMSTSFPMPYSITNIGGSLLYIYMKHKRRKCSQCRGLIDPTLAVQANKEDYVLCMSLFFLGTSNSLYTPIQQASASDIGYSIYELTIACLLPYQIVRLSG